MTDNVYSITGEMVTYHSDPDPETIKLFTVLLDMAKSGELIGITGVELCRDRESGHSGTLHRSYASLGAALGRENILTSEQVERDE